MMLFDLIAAIAAGFVVAGTLMLLRRTFSGLIPGWMIPVSAGLAMIGYGIWSEYTWYDRTVATLPETVTILSAPDRHSALRPWTYILPLKDRFMAVDGATVRRNPAVPDQRIAEIMVAARYGAQGRLPVLVDCAKNRRADLVDGVRFDENGAVIGASWQVLEPQGPLERALCQSE